MKLQRLRSPAIVSIAMVVNILFAQGALAAPVTVDGASVVEVAVNGGADTSNPGVTCIRITPSAPAACNGGWVAIGNNNKQLVATALLAKSTGSKVALILDNATGNQHCPWITFTPCSVNTLWVK